MNVSNQEKQEWILANCVDEYGEIILSDLKFPNHEVHLSRIRAEAIYNYTQKAEIIHNGYQKAKIIHNNDQEAKKIFNNNQVINKKSVK